MTFRSKIFEAEHLVACPTCKQEAGWRCKTSSGATTDYPHAARHRAWCSSIPGRTREVTIKLK